MATLWTLIKATDELLEMEKVTVDLVASVVGGWTYRMLVRRGALSIFQEVYKFLHAKPMGTSPPGGTFEHGSFVSHRWYAWPEATEGNLLSEQARLGDVTLERVGEQHLLER